MSRLKLFVSHSSRLDDVDANGLPLQHNWDLLAETCAAIRDKYGNRIEVLVDKDGLLPAQKWNHELNVWLVECHVAVILFSKRAIEKSDWVAKEAAILSWRAELDPDFRLIPVMLDGQSTPEDLAKDFFGVLRIDENQCIRNAQTADDILAGLVAPAALGEPEQLAGAYPQTPMEYLQGGIAKLLRENTTPASLQKALRDVGCEPLPAGRPRAAGEFADLLARAFLTLDTGPDVSCAHCFKHFQLGVDALDPPPLRERAFHLFRNIRSLWLDPAAAGCIPFALNHKRPIALSGQFICLADPIPDSSSTAATRVASPSS